MDPDGDGAKYWQSEKLSILSEVALEDPVVVPPMPDLIAGLLAHWVGLSPVIGFTSGMAWLTYVHGTS